MDAESQQILNDILKKTVHEFTEYDMAFLRARSTYLTKAQRKEYRSILQVPQQAATEPQAPLQPTQQAPKKEVAPILDEDERLDLDKPAAPANQEQAENTGGGSKEDDEETVEEEFKDEDEDDEEEDETCLDPDCTHEDHE